MQCEKYRVGTGKSLLKIGFTHSNWYAYIYNPVLFSPHHDAFTIKHGSAISHYVISIYSIGKSNVR